jgi:hypothetical protein
VKLVHVKFKYSSEINAALYSILKGFFALEKNAKVCPQRAVLPLYRVQQPAAY